MFYRECGVFKDTYKRDMAIFPIPLDRWGIAVMLFLAFVVIPLVADDYWLSSIMIPFYCFSLAALGLNFLTGYAGQVSIGHAAFMAVGAYSSLVLYSRYGVPLLPSVLGGGAISAAVGAVFGIPSLRIKGFLPGRQHACRPVYHRMGPHPLEMGQRRGFRHHPGAGSALLRQHIDSPVKKYFMVLLFMIFFVIIGKNLVRGQLGRNWMAIRDMDVAAEIIGISLFRYKLYAFAISAFYAGVAGALVTMTYYGAANIEEFNLFLSFHLLGMIIIGGMGTVVGSFFGAGFMVLLPILINQLMLSFLERVPSDVRANSEAIVFGGLIVLFLIVEPYGMARLWQTIKDKMRLWPFPY